jgi:hypothetical protein
MLGIEDQMLSVLKNFLFFLGYSLWTLGFLVPVIQNVSCGEQFLQLANSNNMADGRKKIRSLHLLDNKIRSITFLQ